MTESVAQSEGITYDFGGRLSRDFPSQIIVDITEVCNLACIHCPHPAFKESPHYQARYLDPALNRKIVDEVRQHGAGRTQYIRYTSEGEPLIHPEGYEMIEYAAKNSGVYITLTTNGTIMNEKRTRRILDAGVHLIDISIDAYTPETYAKVRVNGKLDVTRANVLNLLKWVRGAGLPTKVIVSFIEQPENAAEIEPFVRFWKEAGANDVVIRRLHSASGAVVKIADIMRASQVAKARKPCVYPWERVILNPRGFLSFCPTDWVNAGSFADYRETTVAETWQGDFYRRLRQAHLDNDFSNHRFCGQCPDWNQTRWPGEGRAYADMVEEQRNR